MINVLLVDDSEIIISCLKEILKEIKNIRHLETAGTLKQAQEIINKKKSDVIVLDIQMPDGNGLEFLKWIKKKYPEMIVMMFSTFADSFSRNAAKKHGADYFFDKSAEFEQIAETISKIQLQ